MEDGLFLWFLCGCYLVGGITIGWFGGIWWRKRKPKRTGTGRWDYRQGKRPSDDGDYYK
jgi:hypothetical protein|tara:strand:- start:42 stop:218 length:177 start_codon:yes stop_codon:yes gene_type:complete